jgi:hypothetical protein
MMIQYLRTLAHISHSSASRNILDRPKIQYTNYRMIPVRGVGVVGAVKRTPENRCKYWTVIARGDRLLYNRTQTQ